MHAILKITNVPAVERTIPKITNMAKVTKITNQGSDNGKFDKSLKESRERPFTNV